MPFRTLSPTPTEVLPTIPSSILAQLYRDSLTNPGIIMTGSVSFGVQDRRSDVDFLVTQEYFSSLGLSDDDRFRHYDGEGETRSCKYIQEGEEKPIINVIVARDRYAFDQWKYATNMCKHIGSVDHELLKKKSRRVSLFRSFCNAKRNMFYDDPVYVEHLDRLDEERRAARRAQHEARRVQDRAREFNRICSDMPISPPRTPFNTSYVEEGLSNLMPPDRNWGESIMSRATWIAEEIDIDDDEPEQDCE